MLQAGNSQPQDREGRALGCQEPKDPDLVRDPSPARPAIFTITDSLLDAHFVLATLSEPSPNSQDLRSPELCRQAPQLQAHR